MAEIHFERKQQSFLPWVIGIVLLALLILGLTGISRRHRAAAATPGTAAVDTTRDDDPTPRRLRQFAGLTTERSRGLAA